MKKNIRFTIRRVFYEYFLILFSTFPTRRLLCVDTGKYSGIDPSVVLSHGKRVKSILKWKEARFNGRWPSRRKENAILLLVFFFVNYKNRKTNNRRSFSYNRVLCRYHTGGMAEKGTSRYVRQPLPLPLGTVLDGGFRFAADDRSCFSPTDVRTCHRRSATAVVGARLTIGSRADHH